MKKIGVILLLGCGFSAFAQTLYVHPSVDLRAIPEMHRPQLAAQQRLALQERVGVRDDLMGATTAFLQGLVGLQEFEKSLWHWSQSGFSDEERWILLDVFEKSSNLRPSLRTWKCRISARAQGCSLQNLETWKLPKRLQDYEGLILDGRAYPSRGWEKIEVSDTFYSWVFVSSKYPDYQFRGTWKQLQSQTFDPEPLVQGSCQNPQAHPDIQAIAHELYYGDNCRRPSLPASLSQPSFYDRHKKTIWWTVGAVVGASLLSQLSSKTIVIDKPRF
ncbi:MAG: hypothetical protein ACK5Y2_13230 [Bdellovibrionales bacterium]